MAFKFCLCCHGLQHACAVDFQSVFVDQKSSLSFWVSFVAVYEMLAEKNFQNVHERDKKEWLFFGVFPDRNGESPHLRESCEERTYAHGHVLCLKSAAT